MGLVGVVLLAGAVFSALVSVMTMIRAKPADAPYRRRAARWFIVCASQHYSNTIRDAVAISNIMGGTAAVALAPANADVLDS